MILNFLKTKVGLATLGAIILIGGAATIKIKDATSNDVQKQVGLIADSTVQNAIQSGAPSNMDGLTVSTTTDSKISTLVATAASTTPENLTATDRFSRLFFQKYIELKQSGASIDQNAGANLANQLLAQDYGGPNEEKTYTESDIKIVNTDSLQAIKQYGNNLGAILQKPLPVGYEQELSIISRVSNTYDTTDLKKLALNIARYKSMRDSVLALSVPNPLKTAHLALINSLSAILEGVRGMALMGTDPVGAAKMVARYQDGVSSVAMPIEIMKEYFRNQSISFSSFESGYILTQ